MTVSLALYTVVTRLLEPLAPIILTQRVNAGKEDAARVGERLARADVRRPSGPLVWLHAASVGESRLALDLFAAMREQRSEISALITTQTTTSASLIAAAAPAAVIHQMAPVDAPGAVRRFLDNWRPDAAVFTEGEIWPNMLLALRRRQTPSALVNARMTSKTLAGWRSRSGAAREVFAAFSFIGAADQATADGLSRALDRSIGVIGNLKQAAPIVSPPQTDLLHWRDQVGNRPVLLAASTHLGEDEIALTAFTEVRHSRPDSLLILVPRHPERGQMIASAARARGLTTRQKSLDNTPPGPEQHVLVADTMGELLFWYAVSDAIYLGGAHAPGVGGHNAIEPARLGKRAFTGPDGFNFAETFARLQETSALVIGGAEELAAYWLSEIRSGSESLTSVEAFFAEAAQSFNATRDACLSLLPAGTQYA